MMGAPSCRAASAAAFARFPPPVTTSTCVTAPAITKIVGVGPCNVAPVRILAVTDVHYRLGHFDWLLANSASADVIVISGDLADIASPVPLEVQIVVIERYLEQLAESAVVLVVSGNHDLDGPGTHGEQVASWLRRPRNGPVHGDGARVDLDGYRFTMCPWWDGPITRPEVDPQLERAAVDRPRRWIWLYHAPPAGTVLCFDGR